MRCDRCNAIMRETTLYGTDSAIGEKCTSYVCLICGEVLDPVILANRALKKKVSCKTKELEPIGTSLKRLEILSTNLTLRAYLVECLQQDSIVQNTESI